MYKKLLIFLIIVSAFYLTNACSVLYYIDAETGKIYVANNEDYWYDVKPYLQYNPAKKHELARVWYGWKKFAQGGINEAGLFFDGAVAPTQLIPAGYSDPQYNLGDKILAQCKTTTEAINFLEINKIAIESGHILFGDKNGDAAVVEWVNGKRIITYITENYLAMTNFLLSDTTQGNFPCYRFNAIETGVAELKLNNQPDDLKMVGNVIGKAVQLPATDSTGRKGGTLYSTFINITDMELIVVYKLDNSKKIQLQLDTFFEKGKKQKIKMKNF